MSEESKTNQQNEELESNEADTAGKPEDNEGRRGTPVSELSVLFFGSILVYVLLIQFLTWFQTESSVRDFVSNKPESTVVDQESIMSSLFGDDIKKMASFVVRGRNPYNVMCVQRSDLDIYPYSIKSKKVRLMGGRSKNVFSATPLEPDQSAYPHVMEVCESKVGTQGN